MHAPDLLAWLASLPPAARDAAFEEHLDIRGAPSTTPPGEHLVAHHASGIAPIVRMLLEVPVTADDVLVDLGSGSGKVALAARLLTGATVRGVELQPDLVRIARAAASRHGIDASFVQGDAREADLADGTVFFLYLPFTGPALATVLARLREVAARRAIVVCTLGLDVDREASWLVRRGLDSFWLSIHDSAVEGVPPRASRRRARDLGQAADAVALELVRCPPARRRGGDPRGFVRGGPVL